MKNNKKKDSKKTVYLLLLLILGISVGYAALSATLKINGTSIIKSAKWSVYFDGDSIDVTTGSVTGDNVTTAAGIKANTDNSEIEFEVTLPEPGDFYEFTVNVVNDGTLNAVIDTDGVDLSVTAEDSDGNEVTSTTYNDYFTYSVVWDDLDPTRLPAAGDKLAAPTGSATEVTRPVRVRVYYDKEKVEDDDDLPKKDVTFTVNFSMNFVQDKSSN